MANVIHDSFEFDMAFAPECRNIASEIASIFDVYLNSNKEFAEERAFLGVCIENPNNFSSHQITVTLTDGCNVADTLDSLKKAFEGTIAFFDQMEGKPFELVIAPFRRNLYFNFRKEAATSNGLDDYVNNISDDISKWNNISDVYLNSSCHKATRRMLKKQEDLPPNVSNVFEEPVPETDCWHFNMTLSLDPSEASGKDIAGIFRSVQNSVLSMLDIGGNSNE